MVAAISGSAVIAVGRLLEISISASALLFRQFVQESTELLAFQLMRDRSRNEAG